jgi:SAM-dependent methyltransferase
MFASLGFATVLGLVVLLRELGVACHGNEIVYILGIGCWMLAVASGTAWRRAPGPDLAATLLLLTLAIPGSLVLARGLRPLLAIPPDADLSIALVTSMAALLLLPAGFLTGRLFRLAGECDGNQERGRGHRDLAVCLGGCGGGLVAGLLVVLGLSALIAALLTSLVLAIALLGMGPFWQRIAWSVLIMAVLVAIAAGPIDRAMTGWSHRGELIVRETPHGRLALVFTQERITLWRDHLPVIAHTAPPSAGFAAADAGVWELAHLAASQHTDLDEVLLLGGWLEGLPREIARHGQPRIVCLEPDRQLVDLTTRFLADRRQLDDALPTAELIHADARRWLAPISARFDLIVSALPGPLTARDSRYWTLEFIRTCARSLREDGVLALRLRTDHEVWSARETRRLAAVHRTLTEVFADVQVLPGTVTLLLAANRPLERDLAILAARLRDAGVTTVPAATASGRTLTDWLDERWLAGHTQQTTALLASAVVPPNTDLRPTCFADSLLAELGRFIPGLGWREIPQPSRWLAPAIAGGVVLVIALRRRLGAAATLVMGYTGLATVVLAGVLMLDHQIQRGTLYRDLGPLLALVALGAATGIRLGDLWPLRRTGRPTDGRWRLPILHVLISIWSFLVTLGLLLGQHPLAPLLWLLGTGLLAAMIGATVARLGDLQPGRRRTAVLTGGGLGALLAAVLLLPFSGLPATALTVAVLAFPAALSIWPLPGQSLESS